MDFEAIYERKRAFVESTLASVLKAFNGFEGIDYVRDPLTEEEYMRIKDEANGPAFINVTGNSHEAIAREVSRVILGQKPIGLITNTTVKRAIAPMFRKEA